jgi:molybdopterin synthase sulfur carrier subunit
MTTVSFTPNLRRHVEAPPARVEGDTVRKALDAYFTTHPGVRGYVLDDQDAVRKHVVVFLNGHAVRDRVALSDAVADGDEIFVFQALSGG